MGGGLHTLVVLVFVAVGGASVVPARNVSFLVGIHRGVRMYSTATVGSFANISYTPDGYRVDYHLKRNTVYIYVYNDGIYKSTMDPKLDTDVARLDRVGKLVSPANSRDCEGFAVDWVHNTIYWMDCSTNTLKMMDLEGNNVTTLKKTSGYRKRVKRMEVDPVVGKLFWVDDGTLEYSDLTGENFHTNVSLVGMYVRAFTLDLAGRRVFYISTYNAFTNIYDNLYEMTYNSPTVPVDTTKHSTLQHIDSIYGLGVLGGLLYWVNFDHPAFVIYSQPLNHLTGQPHVVQTIEMQAAVGDMKVVDAELQPEWAENPCGRAGCSHHCVHQRGLARCLCPDGMGLTGNTTCTSILVTSESYTTYNPLPDIVTNEDPNAATTGLSFTSESYTTYNPLPGIVTTEDPNAATNSTVSRAPRPLGVVMLVKLLALYLVVLSVLIVAGVYIFVLVKRKKQNGTNMSSLTMNTLIDS